MEKKNICDICGEYSDTLYLDLSSGLWLCPECYFANDFDDEFDIDDDFDVE
jgi:formylmethanofuran dehydrogenase subunit E